MQMLARNLVSYACRHKLNACRHKRLANMNYAYRGELSAHEQQCVDNSSGSNSASETKRSKWIARKSSLETQFKLGPRGSARYIRRMRRWHEPSDEYEDELLCYNCRDVLINDQGDRIAEWMIGCEAEDDGSECPNWSCEACSGQRMGFVGTWFCHDHTRTPSVPRAGTRSGNTKRMAIKRSSRSALPQPPTPTRNKTHSSVGRSSNKSATKSSSPTARPPMEMERRVASHSEAFHAARGPTGNKCPGAEANAGPAADSRWCNNCGIDLDAYEGSTAVKCADPQCQISECSRCAFPKGPREFDFDGEWFCAAHVDEATCCYKCNKQLTNRQGNTYVAGGWLIGCDDDTAECPNWACDKCSGHKKGYRGDWFCDDHQRQA